MTGRVLVAGHWEGGAPAPSSTSAAVLALAEGFTAERPEWRMTVVPFGGGGAFAESVEAAAAEHWAVISVSVEDCSTAEAGRAARAALDAGRVPIVEGGHNTVVDCGIGFLSAFTGIDLVHRAALETRVRHALDEARRLLAGRELVAAASTGRPLLGLSSVLAVDPELEPRREQDRELTALLTRALADRNPGRRFLPLADAPEDERAIHWGKIAGSGAAGGAGAVIGAIGGRIEETGRFLRATTGIDDLAADADLVIALEPRLHSPELADSCLDAITGAAAIHGIPVVGVGVESSLSAHERAEWGLHGQFVTNADIDLAQAGRRIARTWAR